MLLFFSYCKVSSSPHSFWPQKLSLQGEIDYRAEAENTQRWYDNFKERMVKGNDGEPKPSSRPQISKGT